MAHTRKVLTQDQSLKVIKKLAEELTVMFPNLSYNKACQLLDQIKQLRGSEGPFGLYGAVLFHKKHPSAMSYAALRSDVAHDIRQRNDEEVAPRCDGMLDFFYANYQSDETSN